MDQKLHCTFKQSQEICKKIAEIDQFKGKWLATEGKNNQFLKECKRAAIIKDIGSSLRIEGIAMSDNNIEKIIEKTELYNLENKDKQKVFGYYDVLTYINESYENIILSENNILQLHNLLFEYSPKDFFHKGNYKKSISRIDSIFFDKQEYGFIDTTPPHLVKSKMDALLTWTHDAFHENSIHPILIISLFIYEFVSIHPFQNGMRCLSGLLTRLLLLKKVYPFIQYASFEHIIEKRIKEYYTVLQECQKKKDIGKSEKIDSWVLFFINGILHLIYQFEKEYTEYKSIGGYLNERQKKIMKIVKETQPVRLADINALLEKVSINTLKKDLKYLVIESFLRKVGKNKGTSYFLKEN